jgi:predicted secreted protein
MSPITITNKINGDWQESISGTKQWSVNCGGTYVKNAKGLSQLEEAFMNNQEIEVKVILDDCSYAGSALIIDFPLSAIFNSQFKYSLRLLGSGELKLQK